MSIQAVACVICKELQAELIYFQFAYYKSKYEFKIAFNKHMRGAQTCTPPPDPLPPSPTTAEPKRNDPRPGYHIARPPPYIITHSLYLNDEISASATHKQ